MVVVRHGKCVFITKRANEYLKSFSYSKYFLISTGYIKFFANVQNFKLF